MSLVKEITRRKVFKVAVAYGVVGWVLVQVVATVEAPLNLPGWMDTFVIILVAVGFPLALILSWIYDVTPDGIVRTPRSTESAKAVPVPREAPPVTAEAPQREVLRNSVAVLPLENLSPNPDDAYFAAGIHEEIVNNLAKIKDLSVIARTSVKRYEGTAKPISEIARELGVGTVMEGSVRYAGKRVRVTAQLIGAATEQHLWSDVYERDLSDVFGIQADIASNIAAALEAEFTIAEQDSIKLLPTTRSDEAHALFLRSQALFSEGDSALSGAASPGLRASIQALLDRVIEIDPDYAAPYAFKALLYAVSRIYDPFRKEDWVERSAEHDAAVRFNAEKALSLNAELGIPHFALALHHHFNWRGSQGREAYERALALRPNDSHILTWYSTLRWFLEDFEGAIPVGERAVALDPGNSLGQAYLGLALHAAGRHEAALEIFEKANAAHAGWAVPYMLRAMTETALGREAAAVEALRLADRLMPHEAVPALRANIGYGYRRLGQHEEAKNVIAALENTTGDRFVDPAVWTCAHLALGQTERALRRLVEAVEKPEYRQSIFVRMHIKENHWSDPVLEQRKFTDARKRLAFVE